MRVVSATYFGQWGIATGTITPLGALETFGERAGPVRPPLLLVASNRLRCETARRWLHGEFPGADLIVVGSRNPRLTDASLVRQIALPLRPNELVQLVQGRAVTTGDVCKVVSRATPGAAARHERTGDIGLETP